MKLQKGIHASQMELESSEPGAKERTVERELAIASWVSELRCAGVVVEAQYEECRSEAGMKR